MEKFKDFEKHLTRFIGMATVIFFFVAIFHGTRVFLGWDIVINGVALPMSISYLVLVMTVGMFIMGVAYYKR